jgi:hypothetical protein
MGFSVHSYRLVYSIENLTDAYEGKYSLAPRKAKRT